LLDAADAAEKSIRSWPNGAKALDVRGRIAIRGVLYTFSSAYRRLAPSGLRRFILRYRIFGQ
jgi:hypothetical protein